MIAAEVGGGAVAGEPLGLDGDGLAAPVLLAGRGELGAAAAVVQAADDFMLRVVVGGFGIFVQVKAGEAADALEVDRVGGAGQSIEVEGGQAFL